MREPSTLELAEDLRELTAAINEHTRQVNTRFDALAATYLPREVYEVYHKTLRAEVARLDTAMTAGFAERDEQARFTRRTAITGLLLPVVVAVVLGLLVMYARSVGGG